MKKGDRVRVIEINPADDGSNIEIDDIGVITDKYIDDDEFTFSDIDVFFVKFDKALTHNESNSNINEDGTYDMFRYQLEVITEDNP